MSANPIADKMAEAMGHSSPEVPGPILRRDAEIIAVGQVGYRVSKYGILGLETLFKYLGESAKSEPVKEWAWAIGRGTGAVLSLLGLLFFRGRATREIAFGAVWENLTYAGDWAEKTVKDAMGVK